MSSERANPELGIGCAEATQGLVVVLGFLLFAPPISMLVATPKL